jgi:hypothetical protein
VRDTGFPLQNCPQQAHAEASWPMQGRHPTALVRGRWASFPCPRPSPPAPASKRSPPSSWSGAPTSAFPHSEAGSQERDEQTLALPR